MDKKNQQSKAQFGTLTATSDANNDYTQGKSSTPDSAATTSSSMAEFGTMTAKFDANNDYSGKPGKQSQDQSGSGSQAGGPKTKTSDKNIGR